MIIKRIAKVQIERRRAYQGGCWRREQRMNGWMRFLWEFSSKHSLPHCFGLQGSKYLYLCFSMYLYLQYYSAHSIVFPCCCIDLFPLGGKATWQTCEGGKWGSRNCQPGNLKKTLFFFATGTSWEATFTIHIKAQKMYLKTKMKEISWVIWFDNQVCRSINEN